MSYTDDEVIAAVRVAAETLGHTPTLGEWARCRMRPTATTIHRRFGWANALVLAGLEPGSDLSYAKLDETAELARRHRDGESLASLGREIGITGQALGRRVARYERLVP
jgi:hypothetical protein